MTLVAERFMTVPEIASELRVPETNVRAWLRDGKLKGILLSRKAGWRVTREDLERFIDSRRSDQP